MSENRKIRCAMLGYGGAFNMGKGHSDWINAAPGMEAVAACDLDPARMESAKKDFPHFRTYTDVSKMLEDDGIDLVVIITPHDSHAKLAIQSLNAGKNVVVEKPMCLTVQEATDMIEAAKKNDKVLTTFHNRRHDGDFMAIREVVRKGLLGEVFHIEAFMGGYGHPGHWWRTEKRISGGCFYDWGAHVVDWVLQLLPEKMESVTGFYYKKMWHDVTNEDQTEAIIRFKNGAMADIQMSSIAATGKPRFRILGTKGALVDDWKEPFKVNTEVDGIRAHLEFKYKESNWPAYYANLAKCLLEGAPLEVTPESSRRIITVFETAEKSSKSGKAEPVLFE
ncbi:MAG: Gfo/Idh/MocA family oxidoreductase [Armatimonadota bacterium]|nr:Gfo/Idh/MocA family oxidoreductase [Armatimonadota bacterium]